MEVGFTFQTLVIVFGVAFLAPFLLGLAPGLRLPAVVLEILLGIAIGPSGLGWVTMDPTLEVLSVAGVAFLFFLAGGEIELDRIPREILRVALLGFAISVGLAFAAAFGLAAGGFLRTPFVVGILLVACGLGVVVPVLKDSGQLGKPFGEFVITGAALREFGAVLLLAIFFATGESTAVQRLGLLALFLALCVGVALIVQRLGRIRRFVEVLERLADTTAQIRIRGALLLLLVFAALAERVNLEIILGTFFAGMLVMLSDRTAVTPHPQFRVKLEAVGFGVFIPVFFVTSGIQFDLGALLASPQALALAPIFLILLLAIHGLPALVYLPMLGGRGTAAAGLLQASSLSFLVAGSQIALELGVIDAATASALVTGGLLSSVIYPLVALTVLSGATGLVRPRTKVTVRPRRTFAAITGATPPPPAGS